MSEYKYTWTKNHGADAQAVGAWLAGLAVCSPAAIVEAAKNKRSPAHDIIWSVSDGDAAMQHRLNLARTMVNSLEVEVVSSKNEPQQVRAFIRNMDKSAYTLTLEASDEELTTAEQRCWQQMAAFKRRWKGLQFARTVIDAINDTSRIVARKK